MESTVVELSPDNEPRWRAVAEQRYPPPSCPRWSCANRAHQSGAQAKCMNVHDLHINKSVAACVAGGAIENKVAATNQKSKNLRAGKITHGHPGSQGSTKLLAAIWHCVLEEPAEKMPSHQTSPVPEGEGQGAQEAKCCNDQLSSSIYIYIYIYVFVCVCCSADHLIHQRKPFQKPSSFSKSSKAFFLDLTAAINTNHQTKLLKANCI